MRFYKGDKIRIKPTCLDYAYLIKGNNGCDVGVVTDILELMGDEYDDYEIVVDLEEEAEVLFIPSEIEHYHEYKIEPIDKELFII